jgi:hypothetical protein
MKVIILDGILGSRDDYSVIKNVPAFQNLATESGVLKLNIPTGLETPEAIWLGMERDEAQMQQGPLSVAALGFDPPDRSIHFHLSLTSFGHPVDTELSFEESKFVAEQLKRLDTKFITNLFGEGNDHAMVWEKLGEMRTMPPAEGAKMPEGDGENEFRRLIDDSLNLLGNAEFNLRRIDNELPPLNMLWPWGHGIRFKVPALALRYGYPVSVNSTSMRLKGLARLCGLRHGDRKLLGKGMQTKFVVNSDLTVFNCFREIRNKGDMEELEWLAMECGKHLIEPEMARAKEKKTGFAVIATGDHGALIAKCGNPSDGGKWPFDERTLDEKKAPSIDIEEAIRSALAIKN